MFSGDLNLLFHTHVCCGFASGRRDVPAPKLDTTTTCVPIQASKSLLGEFVEAATHSLSHPVVHMRGMSHPPFGAPSWL